MGPKNKKEALQALLELQQWWEAQPDDDPVEVSQATTLGGPASFPAQRPSGGSPAPDSPAQLRTTSRTGTPRVLVRCLGCQTFDCIRQLRTHIELASIVEEPWLLGHGLIEAPSCTKHGPGDHFRRVSPQLYACSKRSATSDNECRKTRAVCFPLVDQWNRVTVNQVLQLVGLVADNESSSKIARAMNVERKTVDRLMQKLENACVRYTTGGVRKWQRVQVDETFIGKRKNQQGKRVRRRGFWQLTVTEVLGNGATGGTSWTTVKKRDKRTCEDVVRRHLIGTRSTVDTDGWKGYCTVGAFCRHRVVNHSIGFITRTGPTPGVHTNNAEGIHGTLKNFIRGQHGGHFGHSSRQMRRNVALACVKFGQGDRKDVPQRELWALRLQALLLCMKSAYNTSLEDDLETVSADSESDASDMEDDCNINARLTNKGLPDKRCTGKKTPAPDAAATEPSPKRTRPEPPAKPAADSVAPAKSVPKKGVPAAKAVPSGSIVGVPPAVYPLGRVEVDGQVVFRLAGEEGLLDLDVLALRRGEELGRGGEAMMEKAHRLNEVAIWVEDDADVVRGCRPGKLILSVSVRLVCQWGFAAVRRRLWVCIDPEEGWQWINNEAFRMAQATEAQKKRMIEGCPGDRVILWPLYYSQHWVLAILDKRTRRWDILDSARPILHEPRAKTVKHITTFLRSVWTLNMTPTLKVCEQQNPGSNDCGLFTIRNMMITMAELAGAPLDDDDKDNINREWLTRCWETRAMQVLPPLKTPKRTRQAPKRVRQVQKQARSKNARRSAMRSMKREATPRA